MDGTISSPLKPPSPVFGVRAVFGVLLALYLLLIALSPALLVVVEYLRDIEGPLALGDIPDLEARAIARAVEGIVKPWLILCITFAILKSYFRNDTCKSVTSRFGLEWRLPIRLSIISFLVGVSLVGLFSKILFEVFPPEVPPVSHPANVIANAVFWLQLSYAISISTMIPIAEEFVFRGVMYQGLSQPWGKFVAGLIVTISFIWVHGDVWNSGYWLTHLDLCVVSIALIIARHLTGTLTSSIMIHSGVNFAEMFIF